MPVEPAILGAYVLAIAALVVSPGPDTIIILRYTLTSGRDVGLAAVTGVQLGLLVHITLAVAGISLLIASSAVLFKAVAVAGAAYLAWLGLHGFRGGGGLELGGGGAAVGKAKACRDAVLCNLLNPKVILLFLALAGEVIGRWFDRAGVRRAVSRVTGSILLGFAALMLYEHLIAGQ